MATLSIGGSASAQTPAKTSLEEELQSIPATQLAQDAVLYGEATRGALIFYQPSLACSRCHSPSNDIAGNATAGSDRANPAIGPDLARFETARPTDSELVESLLHPSRSIRQGFETRIVKTSDDEIITGIALPSSETELQLRLANGQTVSIPRSMISESQLSKESMMPSGQVNLLSDRQQFLDLVKYVIEIRDGGPQRAMELKPADSLLVLKIPEYESHLDHAGLINAWGQDSMERGQAIYRRVCANCHGTRDQLGSLPTALRFAEGKFKNGSDPLSVYRTLTHGFGFMPAQSWMVPSQKYDVIHYIRETFMKDNPNVHSLPIDTDYVSQLPRGDTRGPEPSPIEVWSAMDYGNHLAHCYEIPGDKLNIAYKGIAIRLDPGPGGIARGNQWMVFDTDTLRWAAGWTVDDPDKPNARFIDWRDIQFNGEHGIHPRIVGRTLFANAVGPGWAEPTTHSWNDVRRVLGRDDRRYGPLPKEWGKFRGTYTHGSRTIVSYTIGGTEILETPMQWTDKGSGEPILVRILQIAPHTETLGFRVADLEDDESASLSSPSLIRPNQRPQRADQNQRQGWSLQFPERSFGVIGPLSSVDSFQEQNSLCISLAPSETSVQLAVWISADRDTESNDVSAMIEESDFDLQAMTHGSPAHWPQILETEIATAHRNEEFRVEALTWPDSNPWLAQMRLTGLDFFSDGSMAVCSWDGDVWHVRESTETNKLSWRRMAAGLYQPLGLKILNDTIYISCRDQIAILRDLNGDGEAEYVECFNNDHQVTEHFHEFAMGLQADEDGNLYYAKSGRHALKAIVPQHGTLLRVAFDGSKTDILATGFRAANGVCLNPDGSFIVTDQEGFWNPKNRINWVTVDPGSKPKFYGNMFGYHDGTDPSDDAMEAPLCWITNAFDRSPAELLWLDSPAWKELEGSLLNLSYGYGKVFLVLHEAIDGIRQAGMIELPIPSFPTGIMRGRLHPRDHSLIVCGMFSWAGNATAPGGLYRLRKTDAVTTLPIELHAKEEGIELVFAQPLDPKSMDKGQVQIEVWGLKRTANYGSEHINQHSLPVTGIDLSEDGKRVMIRIDGIAPTWGMQISYAFQTESGRKAQGKIHNTIHRLAE
jgi:putative heme-binding domain-containing protein